MDDTKHSIIKRIYEKFISSLSFIGSIWIVLLMVIIMVDVLGRNLFNQPLVGTPEIVKNSIVGITFLQITHVLKEGRHIRTTLLLDRLPGRGKEILYIFSCVLGMAIFGLIAYAEGPATFKAFVTGEFDGEGLKIPTYPTHALIFTGSLLMFIQYFIFLCQHIKKLFAPSNMNTQINISNNLNE